MCISYYSLPLLSAQLHCLVKLKIAGPLEQNGWSGVCTPVLTSSRRHATWRCLLYQAWCLDKPSHLAPLAMLLTELEEHPGYFFEDGDVLLLVENSLFCIHSYFLRRESTVFSRLLAFENECNSPRHRIPANELDGPVTIERFNEFQVKTTLEDQDLHSTYIKQAFRIEGYTPTALSNLLWMFYNTDYNFTPQGGDPTPEEAICRWLSILTSSIMFAMPNLRGVACKSLSALSRTFDPIIKIQLSRVYRLEHDWAKDAWVTLCTRQGSVNQTEAFKLGMEYVIKAMRARENVIQRAAQNLSIDETWLMDVLFSDTPPPTFVRRQSEPDLSEGLEEGRGSTPSRRKSGTKGGKKSKRPRV